METKSIYYRDGSINCNIYPITKCEATKERSPAHFDFHRKRTARDSSGTAGKNG